MTDTPTVYSLTRPHLNVRASDLTGKLDVVKVFASQGSARALAAAITVLVSARAALGEFGPGDLAAPVVSIAITGTVEWVIHRGVLHAPADAWTSRVLGLGVGHRAHHLHPVELRWLLLSWLEASLFIVLLGAVTAAWAFPLIWITGSASIGPFLTGWACAAIALLHYEWVHLLVHSRYRPTSRHYGRLARHHRLHHVRDEHSWFGITSTSGDRLFRTAPRHHGAVELGPTARTLGVAVDAHHVSSGNRHSAR
jgi:hypothetical protein